MSTPYRESQPQPPIEHPRARAQEHVFAFKLVYLTMLALMMSAGAGGG